LEDPDVRGSNPPDETQRRNARDSDNRTSDAATNERGQRQQDGPSRGEDQQPGFVDAEMAH
jgi:hypothetical protein